MPTKPWYYECEICGNLHPWAFEGDCRENKDRLTLGELWAKHGFDGFQYMHASERAEMKEAGGNLMEDPEVWLKAQFEFEWCPECGRDHRHHTAMPFLGNWRAWCDKTPDFGGENGEPTMNPEGYP